jgi:hypothetical protein
LNPLGLAEEFELIVETPGRVALPLEVRAELGLKPGDLFSIVTHPVSLRLESYRELLADCLEVSLPNRGFYSQGFFRRPWVVLEADGAFTIPGEVGFPFSTGDRLVLDVVTRGLSHELYLYRVED